MVTSLRDKLCLSAEEHFSLVLEHVKSLKRNKLTLLDPDETLARVSEPFYMMIAIIICINANYHNNNDVRVVVVDQSSRLENQPEMFSANATKYGKSTVTNKMLHMSIVRVVRTIAGNNFHAN